MSFFSTSFEGNRDGRGLASWSSLAPACTGGKDLKSSSDGIEVLFVVAWVQLQGLNYGKDQKTVKWEAGLALELIFLV